MVSVNTKRLQPSVEVEEPGANSAGKRENISVQLLEAGKTRPNSVLNLKEKEFRRRKEIISGSPTSLPDRQENQERSLEKWLVGVR